jgi:hypothetical protein
MQVFMSMLKTFELDLDVRCQLCDACVGSTMSFGVQVWGFKRVDVIGRVYLKFLKRILGVKVGTCYAAVYGRVHTRPILRKNSQLTYYGIK